MTLKLKDVNSDGQVTASTIASTPLSNLIDDPAPTGSLNVNLTADVAANIRNAAQGADETGETSSRMFASAQNLSSESLQLKAEVEKFLDRVRAA